MLAAQGMTRLFLGGNSTQDGTIDVGGNYTITGGNGIGDLTAMAMMICLGRGR